MVLEQKIGFDKVREKIAAKCATQYALRKVEAEQISRDPGEIMFRLRLTDEMRLICLFEDSFPAGGYLDTKAFLLPLQAENTTIDLPSLRALRTSLDTLRRILAFFRDCKDDLYPTLRQISASVTYEPEIGRRIETILDRAGEVRDTASQALGEIRRTLRSKEGQVSRRINAILGAAKGEGLVDTDAEVVVRDGRVLIPVPAGAKKKLPGIVYDESASGKTAFVEPLEIIELGNQIRELQFDEQREIARILFEFTEFLRPYLGGLIAASEYIGEIDFIRSKALVALDMIAGMPILSEGGELNLRRARHPLLEASLRREKKEIVPLTLSLTRDKHILLISGPNAGGKSVCLKTVGLLQYMFQWGMLIPTSEVSEMMIFDSIFIDIGDDQSLENDLSTYSSHLKNMREILTHATASSLVLIDEFGSGTEPAAGGAIAEAVLARLDEMGVYGVITTHYTNLKLYADKSSGVVNGAMLFDGAAIKPLFQLQQGMPGNSFAFELARKMGLPGEVVKDAEERAGSEFVNIERNLRQIARSRRALDEKLARIKTTDKTLESLTDKYEKELSEVKALKKSILDEAKKEAQEILAEANKQVERTIREIREAQAEREKTRTARENLAKFKEEIQAEHPSQNDAAIERKMQQIVARKERERQRKVKRGEIPGQAGNDGKAGTRKDKAAVDDSPLQVGDKVRLKDNDMVGEVTQIAAKYISVSIGSIISKIAPGKVEKISNQQYKEKSRSTFRPVIHYDSESISRRKLEFRPTIDIRGERLNDALEIVMHFIDDATMVGVGQVKILHGKGNGVLREEIRKYLKTVPAVASFRDEAVQQGGAGITVVEMDI
ncbi:MAG: Smr/MutS family protein [Bacteroidales bacterium]|nr:Smr/MutS family protein [Bacteroidales bacterium]MBQ4013145.1 Smr/MutS family protein [Bacteroidales bacterium]